ncbi:MAG: hypothetical protein LBF37_00430 [Rickettsiales bacterium]|jgi:hypothetical protein|nr:hypothetical protein [Rickettsiales bacterium]
MKKKLKDLFDAGIKKFKPTPVDTNGINPQRFKGIAAVFKHSAELAEITTESEYSDYIDSIYPGSKVKGLVYHQTERKFDKFDENKSRTGGIYFSPYNRPTGKALNLFFTGRFESYTKIAVINLESPLFMTEENKNLNITNIKKITKKVDLTKYDGIVGYCNFMYYKGEFAKGYLDTEEDKSLAEIVVFNSDDIHILGSQKDIEQFKEWKKERNMTINNEIIKKSLENSLG